MKLKRCHVSEVWTCLGMTLVLGLLAASAGAQPLDETWTLTVAGQSVQANADGSFVISNIPAPDLFGLDGPGSATDSLSDDFVRLTGVSTAGSVPMYVFSEPFQVTRGQTFSISPDDLTFTATPPPLPVSLSITSGSSTLTAIDQVTQLQVIATLGDGSNQDVTQREAWTVYRTSNSDIATVDRNGQVRARGRGRAILTAVNGGSTAVTSVTVWLDDPLTDVEGFAVTSGGNRAEGARVVIFDQDREATSDEDGFFQFQQLATGLTTTSNTLHLLDVAAILVPDDGCQILVGSAIDLEPLPGGITDAGIIHLTELGDGDGDGVPDDDGDGVPDNLEIALGLDPDNADSDRDDIDDLDEDLDGDGLPDVGEFIMDTDPLDEDTDDDGIPDGDEDTDNDFLTDGYEISFGTNPYCADTDGDGTADVDELKLGTDPRDYSSQPPRFVESLRVSYLNAIQAPRGTVGIVAARPASYLNSHLGDRATAGITHSVPVSYLNSLIGERATEGFQTSRVVSYENQ